MKKALLAVLIPSLLGASSAFAGGVDLIKSDDVTLNFNGDIDLKSYVTMTDGESDGTQTEVIFDDIDFDLTYKINDGLTFIAGVDFTADGEGQDNNASSGETNDKEPILTDLAWVGIKTDYGQFMWGNLETSWDPLGIDNSELDGGRASSLTDGNSTSHTNAIRYDLKIDDMILGATYGIPGEVSSKRSDKLNKVTQFTFKYTPGDLLIFAGLGQTTSYDGDAEDDKATYASLEVEYDFGDFTAAVLVAKEDVESDTAADEVSTTALEVDLTYALTSKIKLATGVDYLTQDVDDADDLIYTYVAAKYSFSKLVTVQFDLAREDGEAVVFDGSDKDVNNQIKTGFVLSLDF